MSKLSSDMSSVTTVAVDLAKHVFQVRGCDVSGKVIVAKALRRKDVLPFFASLGPCLVGMEACGSAHHWGRELMALGHEVKLIPPAYVKPFVKRQKNDKNDAAAIYETFSRPGLRFVKVRSVDNQAPTATPKPPSPACSRWARRPAFRCMARTGSARTR